MNRARAHRFGEHGTENPTPGKAGRPPAELQEIVKDWPPGVTVGELSPLFDISRKPWLLLGQFLRQFQVAHTVLKHTGCLPGWKVTGQELRILDAAAGYGELYTLLRDARRAPGTVIEYIGVDLDDNKVDVGTVLRPNIDLRVLNVLDIPDLGDERFNVVVSSETLEHLEHRDGMKFIGRINRVLEPNGLLVLTCPTPAMSERKKHPHHLYEWERIELVSAVKSAGFNIIDQYPLMSHERDWELAPQAAERLPNDIVRPTASALLSVAEGTGTMLVARKVR